MKDQQLHAIAEVPAVVIGGGLNALGVVRSLAKGGVPLVVVDTDPGSPAMRSRYGRKLLLPSLEGEGLIEGLMNLAKALHNSSVLFVTEEKTVVTVSTHRDKISENFLFRMPEHERLMQLMHKQGFQELAEMCGAAIPRTVQLQDPDDLRLIEELKFPCVLKPSKKDYTYGARFKKAYKVTSVAEVTKLYRKIHPVLADMVVQEWIEGADSEIYFCLQYIGNDGKRVSSFVGRKIRSWPPRIGGTASCTAAWEVATELTETTGRFFAQVGFTGMGSMEYKRDRHNGGFYMVEPTVARTDFQEEVATINGVNIPLAAYRYELGLPKPPEQKLAIPVVWRDPLSDRWSFEEGDGIVDERSRAHEICDAYWRWNDPLPWVQFMADRLTARLGRTR
jgi:D-aspartate ligase